MLAGFLKRVVTKEIGDYALYEIVGWTLWVLIQAGIAVVLALGLWEWLQDGGRNFSIYQSG